MALTTLIEGMTVAQHVIALNNNMTFIAKHGQPVVYFAEMPQWEILSAHKINGLGDFSSLIGGTEYLNALNAAFTTLNATDTITVVGATDVKTVGATGDGSTDDAAAINAAVATGNILIQDGVFIIGASIKIPSNRTVYLYNCKVKSKNATYDNIFRNADIDNGNVNVNIIGLGSAELDGNTANCDDNYANYGNNVKGAVPPYLNSAYRYCSIFLCKVDTFDVSNLFLSDMPHWYIHFQKSINGVSHDLYHKRYRLSANQGYFTLCYGCHDIDIYNIAGDSRDDYFTIGVSNYSSFSYFGYAGWDNEDVHDINVWNWDMINSQADSFGSMFTGVIGDGGKIYNIDIKDVIIRQGGTVFYSSFSNYIDTACAKTDFYNITMDNIQINSAGVDRSAIFYFGSSMMNTAFTNIKYPLTLLRDYKYNSDTADQSDNVKI